MSHRGAQSSFNAKAKALIGKIETGRASGRPSKNIKGMRKNIKGMRKMNLSEVKRHLHAEGKFKKEQSNYYPRYD